MSHATAFVGALGQGRVAERFMPVLDEPFETAEVADAIKSMADGVGGLDGVPVWMLKLAAGVLAPVLAMLFELLRRGKLAVEDWGVNVVVAVPKKGARPYDLDTFRGVHLASVLAKLYAAVLARRLGLFASIPLEQRYAQKGASCEELVVTLEALSHTRRVEGKPLFAAFLDLRKAFPSVRRELLWQRLYDMGVSTDFIRVLQSLYADTRATVRGPKGYTPPFNLSVGLREGCPLSPLLFALFIADVPRRLRDVQLEGSIKLADYDLRSLFFADDAALLAETPGDLQRLVDCFTGYMRASWISVNPCKSEWMVLGSDDGFRVSSSGVGLPDVLERQLAPGSARWVEVCLHCDGSPIRATRVFKYLGVKFAAGSGMVTAIDGAGAAGLEAWAALRSVFYTEPTMPVSSLLSLHKSLVGSCALFGAEAWGPFISSAVVSNCPVRSLQQAALSLVGGCRVNANLHRLCYMFGQVPWEYSIRRKTVRFFHKALISGGARLMHLCIRHLADFRGTDSWLDRTLAFLDEGGITGELDLNSLSIRGVSEDWFRNWENTAFTRARSAVREGWSANKPSAQGIVLARCREENFRVPALLAAVPVFSQRQLVARFISGNFGVARVHGHFQRGDISKADKRLCLYCLRNNWKAYDDEAHVLLDCPGLQPARLGHLWDFRRLFRDFSSSGIQVAQEQGPARLLSLLRAILYSDSGRVDVLNAYRLGKFLEKAWRIRGAWSRSKSAPFLSCQRSLLGL
jgi:hypothetical protein